LLTQINRVLARIFRKSRIDVFATAFYLVADVASSQLFYANAGHPSPLHMCPNKGEVARECVLSNKEPRITGDMGVADMRILVAINEAARVVQPVRVGR
jgi:hypothetical protein